MDFHTGYFKVLQSLLSLLVTLTLAQVCLGSTPGCDLYTGSWVPDNSPKLYDQNSCPSIPPRFNCLKNGRKNTTFLNYRWQPSGCSLPRFDGKDFLSRLRGKSILFVGDSLSHNQWQSLTCMLHAVVPHTNYIYDEIKPLSEFDFPEYQVKISLIWNPFLVDLDKEKKGIVLKLDSIKSGDAWRGVDVLIFNTWNHWVSERHVDFDYIQLGNMIYDDIDRLKAFEIGLNTWSKWIDSNIDASKTRVIFQGISTPHYDGKEWNSTSKNCYQENQPISGSIYPAGDPKALAVVKKVLKATKIKVDFIDITLLSQLRKDGHPSIYGISQKSTDCIHWCLPGVPDTWNQLLYAAFTS